MSFLSLGKDPQLNNRQRRCFKGNSAQMENWYISNLEVLITLVICQASQSAVREGIAAQVIVVAASSDFMQSND